MQYIEAPFEYSDNRPSVFLAGGITGTPGWQFRLAAMLCGTTWVVVNPRRQDFPMGDDEIGREQIAWEKRHLDRASLIAFWFPAETLCPITLYELGVATRMDKPILVGTHPDYARRFDIEVQLGLSRPEVEVADSLEQLASQLMDRCPPDQQQATPQQEPMPCVH